MLNISFYILKSFCKFRPDSLMSGCYPNMKNVKAHEKRCCYGGMLIEDLRDCQMKDCPAINNFNNYQRNKNRG